MIHFKSSLRFKIKTFYCKYRQIKDVLHRCDRAMIYVFIAGSYFPWLSLGDPAHPQICFAFKWGVWLLAALGIVYQQVIPIY